MLALCPHCLEHCDLREAHDPAHGLVLRCGNPDCDETVPRLYGEDYAAHPPVPLTFIGLCGHGRTAYLERLLHDFDSYSQRWAESGFRSTWLDPVRFRQTLRRIRVLREGPPASGDRSVFQQPQILRLHGIPRVGGCQLVMTDAAGEAIVNPGSTPGPSRSITHSSTIVLLLSLKRGDPHVSPAVVSRMLEAYLEVASRLGGPIGQQSLVLALTKGDELIRRADLPVSAREVLDQDDLNPCGLLWRALERASADLEAWLGSSSCGYQRLVELARRQFRTVHYCVTSAFGATSGGHAGSPGCVLAPLLWQWRMNREPVWSAHNRVQDLYLDLAEAVATTDHGTIYLEERTYRLATPVNVTRPVTIVGRGPGRTVLQVTAAAYGLGIRTTGKVTLYGLSICRSSGGPPGDLVRVLAGELDLREVEVSGGRAGEVAQRPVGGCGVQAGGQSRLTMASCSVHDNHGNGVLINERAVGEVVGCKFHCNGGAGVYTRTVGAVTITHGTFCENHTGIWIEAAASAVISANSCERNTESGLTLSGYVGGSVVVRGNTSGENGRDGICIRTAAAPTVVGNSCVANRRCGIACTDKSAGTARDNTCVLNGRHGLRVCHEADPSLEENRAERNAGCGILYEDYAAGCARGNVCQDNRGDGLRVLGGGAPELTGNELRLNDGFGVSIEDAASKADVDSTANTCDGNRQGALRDPRPRKRGSWWSWARYQRQKSPSARNTGDGIVPADGESSTGEG